MAAAAWTADAIDITNDPTKWDAYLSVQELEDRIGLGQVTILDTLTRKIEDPTDPRSAIRRPAARIGPSRLNSMPRWSPSQAEDYIELQQRRDLAGRAAARRELPVYNAVAADRAGLAGTKALAKMFDRAENTLRWWARAHPDTFPAEVGIAEREPPYQFGPPRGLRRIRDVARWIERNARPANHSDEEITGDRTTPAA